MRLRLRRPRDLALALRDLAMRRPREAEEYLDDHAEEWESLAEAEPHNAADILEAIDPETAVDLVRDLNSEEASEVLAEMRPEIAAGLLSELDPARAAEVLDEMSDDDAADVVGNVDPELRPELLSALPDETADAIAGLLAYLPDSAGGLMTAEVAHLPIGLSAGEAIEALRRLHDQVEQLAYVYVVDDEERLRGVISFRELVFARPGTGIEEAMVQDPVAVRPETDREDVARLFQRYGLLALPVVDFRGRLLGAVTVDEVLEAVQEEAGEDIAVMVGAGIGETVHTSVAVSVRNRLPWIAFNLGIAFIIAGVISRFEPLISEFAVLAAYMPVVASVGGNAGGQSLAVVIRSMAIEDIPGHQARKVILRELAVGLINALAVAVAAGVIAGLFTASPRIGFVLGLAAFVNVVVSALAGAGIPLLLKRLGQDPALASNIFLTLIADLIGFGGFLLVAQALL